MSDQRNKQPPPKGWIRASASPMRGNAARLMSPTLNVPRQRSPTPTFNARQFSETPTYDPGHPSPTPPLRRLPPTPTGFTTVFDSQTFSQTRSQQFQSPKPSTSHLPNVSMQPDVSFPRPFRSTFSPVPSAPTPSSLPPFSPPPTPQLQPEYMYVGADHQAKPISDFYVVPLEPGISKGVVVYDQEENRPSTADIIAQQSQDYVDEKLAEYQATISLLQGK